ncbi:PQQ-binding-like beta-propeller repeat protein [Allorhizocola rhizosphaerae]|uniref:PQQ-binding-like beta-propeller repeat protein n=1 Tax=Allorhizocola rhizosphaerae TaxID=1872709 RepID=UPI000E3CF8BF|nr:PQQ-binding-like beta-propeller repeat protein [Allorhizocola rhizosphaerae]
MLGKTLRLIVGTALAVSVGAVPAAQAAPTTTTTAAPPTGCGFQALGTLPLSETTTAGTALDADHPSGPRVYSVTSSATRAVLGVRDAVTGELLHEAGLPGALGSWAVTVAADHRVYVGSYSAGRLYSYDPATQQVKDLGVPIPGDTFIWTVAAAPDGSVWGGTSYHGHVFRHDPATGVTTDLGTPIPGEQFVRDLAIGEDGTVYAGIGSMTMAVAVLDPAGNVRERIAPPGGVGTSGYAYDVDVVGDRLLVRFQNTAGEGWFATYHLADRRWSTPVSEVDSLTIGGGRHGNDIHLVRQGELTAYDLQTGSLRGTGFTDLGDGAPRPLGWIHVPGARGQTLVGTASGGGMWHYRPHEGTGRRIETTLTAQAVAIRSLAAGPDGLVYAGGFFSGGLATFDPASGNTVGRKGIGQIEGMIAHGGKMYLGVYPNARVYEYDPSVPWQRGSNPRLLFELGSQEQSRPFAWASAGEYVAFGTVPQAGAVGGALGLYHPATGETRVRRDIVPGHSVVGLAYRDGVVYGTTSTWGGTNQPQDDAAVAFAYDIAADRVLWQTAPVPGDLALGAIAFAPDGKLWGLTVDALFELDPATGATLRYQKFASYPWDRVDHVWVDTYLELAADGTLYGKVQGRTYRIARDTMTLSQIVRPTSIMVKGPDGHLYLSRDQNFFTYRIC